MCVMRISRWLCIFVLCAGFAPVDAKKRAPREPKNSHNVKPSDQRAVGQMELLKTDSAIALSQSDFDSGPYRITQPGYYYFTENVSFEPDPEAEAERTDKPVNDWFAALTIECDNVIIDLNTKTFDCSDDFVRSHSFKVFSMIELNNSPFPHFVFAFDGETEIKNAHNVVIKNGTLGRSSHHGIHGNNNSNVHIHDLVIRDWEVAGISLNGLLDGYIHDVTVSGLEHVVPFTGQLALMQATQVTLQDLADGGDETAATHLAALNALLADSNFNGENHPSGIHEGNCYGIFLNRAVDVGPVPTTHCQDGTINCVMIENVTVCNVKNEIIETVGIASNDNTRLKGNPFGVLRWNDAYPSGSFAPNDLLKAQVYAGNAKDASAYPAGFAANILAESPNEATFLSHAKPIFNGDFAGHTNKGAFGIRVDCGHGVTIKDCNVVNVQSIGAKGADLSTISAGENYDFQVGRYTGNDVHGLALAACRNCCVVNTKVVECWSQNGHVRGIAVNNDSESNVIDQCISSDHYAFLDNPNDPVNPSSEVVGIFVDNAAHANTFRNCITQSLESPRAVYGCLIRNCRDTRMKHCISSDHAAISDQDLDQEKRAIGFASIGSSCTSLRDCCASSLRCTGESAATEQSDSLALGYLLESDDAYAHIEHCKGSCCDAGAGIAAGLLLDGATEGCIIECAFDRNHASVSHGTGYGIRDRAAQTASLFIRNKAFGNKTANYSINFAEGQALPLTTVLYGEFNNLHLTNDWNNISFEPTTGGMYTGNTNNNHTIVRQVIQMNNN